MKLILNHYNLYLKGYNIAVDVDDTTTLTLDFSSPAVTDPAIEDLFGDLTRLNAIRGNTDPAVKDQWEQLLTTIALTSGRDVPKVLNNMVPKSE